jgi:hypothetical protein
MDNSSIRNMDNSSFGSNIEYSESTSGTPPTTPRPTSQSPTREGSVDEKIDDILKRAKENMIGDNKLEIIADWLATKMIADMHKGPTHVVDRLHGDPRFGDPNFKKDLHRYLKNDAMKVLRKYSLVDEKMDRVGRFAPAGVSAAGTAIEHLAMNPLAGLIAGPVNMGIGLVSLTQRLFISKLNRNVSKEVGQLHEAMGDDKKGTPGAPVQTITGAFLKKAKFVRSKGDASTVVSALSWIATAANWITGIALLVTGLASLSITPVSAIPLGVAAGASGVSIGARSFIFCYTRPQRALTKLPDKVIPDWFLKKQNLWNKISVQANMEYYIEAMLKQQKDPESGKKLSRNAALNKWITKIDEKQLSKEEKNLKISKPVLVKIRTMFSGKIREAEGTMAQSIDEMLLTSYVKTHRELQGMRDERRNANIADLMKKRPSDEYELRFALLKLSEIDPNVLSDKEKTAIKIALRIDMDHKSYTLKKPEERFAMLEQGLDNLLGMGHKTFNQVIMDMGRSLSINVF